MVLGAAGVAPRRVRHVVSLLAAGLYLGAPTAAPAQDDGPRACGPAAGTLARLAGLAGGDLRLADGRAVRLATVRLGPDAGAAIARRADQPVELRGLGGPDRWGRLTVDAVVLAGAGWLEGELVAAGAALADVPARLPAACGRALLAREAAARAGDAGVWARQPPLAAGDLDGLAAAAGRFVVVEGRVGSVGERRNTVYLNFGDRWSEDFTVTLATRDRGALALAGIDAAALAGRRVRVRGHVVMRGGPMIEVASPAHLELIGTGR